MAKKKELTVEEKLRALYNLQLIDSRVDEIRNVRGELPLEVRDLEDEVEGFKLRYQKLEDNLNEIDNQIKSKKNLIEEAKVLIKKYIKPDICDRFGEDVRFFEPFTKQLSNFLTTGYLADPEAFKHCVKTYFGEVTFGEAYEVTHRVVNISVSTRTSNGSRPLLLNYLSSPSVLIWSAVTASCALPGLIASQQLMAKNKRGEQGYN